MSIDAFRMPLRFLRGNVTRLGLTVIALALGVALVCAIDLVNRAVLQAFVEVIDTMAGRAALQITAGEGGLFPEDTATTVSRVPGVELAVPVVSATALTIDDRGELLTVHGVEITNDAAVRVYDGRDAGGLKLEDPLVFLSQPDSVVLTHTLAQRRGLAVGDSLRLRTPTGARTFAVRGLLEPTGIAKVYGGNLVVMDILAAEAAFARPGFVNRIDVVVQREADVATVAAAIRSIVPAGLRVEAPAQRKADLQKVMHSLQVVLQGLGLITLVAAFLIAFNRLSTVFEARTWQLGVLHAVGARARVVWRALLIESLVLGVAGVALGIPLGIALGRLVLPAISTTTAAAFNLLAPRAEYAIAASSLCVAALLGLVASVLAAALPAWRATRLGAAACIRSRGRETLAVGARMPWMRAATGASIVAAIGLQSATHAPGWGVLASVLIATAAALAAAPLVPLARRLAAPVLHLVAGPSARFGTAALSQHPRRMALTVATLAVGLGAVLWLSTIAFSFEESLAEIFTSTMQSDLIVGSAHFASGVIEAPIDERILAEIQALPGVATVAGDRITDWEYDGGPIALRAFDALYYRTPAMGVPPLSGAATDALEAVARGDAFLVTGNFERNLGAHVGDTITLQTPSGPLTAPIVGITSDLTSPRGTVYLSREVYRRFWHDGRVTHALVQAAPGTDISVLQATIAQHLGAAYGLRVLASGEFSTYIVDQVAQAFAGVHVITAMVLFVVLFGIADTLAAGVIERTRELGTIRALGVRRNLVRRMVLVEAVALSSAGLILALITAWGLGVLWVDATFPYLLGWAIDRHVPYLQATLVSAATMAVALAAGWLPGRRAARLQPGEALRYE